VGYLLQPLLYLTEHFHANRIKTMPTLTSQVLNLDSRKGRQFLGDFAAGMLVAWLNKSVGKRDYDVIVRFLQELQNISEQLETAYETASVDDEGNVLSGVWRVPGKPFPRKPGYVDGYKLTKKYAKQVRFINSVLRSYARPEPLEFMGMVGDAVLWDKAYAENRGYLQVNRIVKLSRMGLHLRIRRCKNCTRWFFARFRHQSYCQEKCQREHFRSSEEWKEKRRVYMRRYMRGH
jgi:hypothetical protein